MNPVHVAHCVGVNEHHLQWCTKYRYYALGKESHYKDCEAAIRTVAERHGIQIVELGVMPDHVHVAAFRPPDVGPSNAISLLKGGSSYMLFRSHPNFRKTYRQDHFWSRSYFYRSFSDVDEKRLRRYVREDNSPRQLTLT